MTVSIGKQLRQAREAQSLSLEDVSHSTHIRVHYLKAMEEDNFGIVPSLAQARGFLRAYANFLKLDSKVLLNVMDGEPQPANGSASLEAEQNQEPTPAIKAPAGGDGEDTFVEVGQKLRQRRELLGLSLEDVERHTHLRRHYLVALEGGDLERLPSPVQGRGMLKNYAVFLGMDAEALLLRFAEGLQARLAVKHETARAAEAKAREQKPPPITLPRLRIPGRLRRFVSGDLLIGAAVAVALTIFVVWGAIRIFSMRSEQAPLPTANSISEVLLATSTATASPTPAPASPTSPAGLVDAPLQETTSPEATAAITPPPGEGEAIQVYITIRQRAWMRVAVDGKIEFEGRVLPENAYSFAGEERVDVLTGNGAGLQVFFQQQDLGLMGAFGEVVQKVYTQDGVLEPTPTITPTPTATPRATPTPPSSPTARPGEATAPALP